MKTFRQFVAEKWTRPQKDSEFDEVGYQSKQDSSLSSLTDRQKYRNAIRTGKEKIIPAYKWRKDNVGNTDAGERNTKSFSQLDPKKRARVTRKKDMEMPIVHKKADGSKALLAGNTRSSRMSLLNRPTKVLEIK